MGLSFSAWAALAILRNTAVIGYLLRTPGAWDLSSLRGFLSETAVPVLAAASLLFLLWCAGRRVARRLALPADGSLAGLPGALGLGLVGTAIFASGLAGRLTLGIGLALTAAALAGLPEAWSLAKMAPFRRHPDRPPLWLSALLVPLSFCLFHVLVNAAAPPVGWDALAYHLAIARLYLDGDAIREIPWLMHSHWPHLMEMLYAVPLALGRENVAALLHALICAGLVATVFLTGREEGGPAAGWSAAALLAAQPVFLEVASEPHSDGALSFFHLLACLALWRWSKTGERKLLAAAGLCSGLAAACKLTGLALGASLVAWLLLDSRRRKGAASFLLWAALPAAPWYLKTWAFAGNPVWPFFNACFGGSWEPALVADGLVRTSLWRFPRDLGLLTRYGPQFLLLPAAGLAAAAAVRLPPRLKFIFLVTAPLAAISVRYHEAWRYLIPLTPSIALACGWWCAQACRRPGPRRAAACAVLAFGLWPSFGLTQSNELFAVLALRSQARPGVTARDVYRERQVPIAGFYPKAAALVPPGGKILLFREIRGYHLRADYQFGDPVNQTQIIYDRLGSPEALRAELARHGLTFVLINEANGLYAANKDYYSARTLALMDATLKRYGRLALREGPFVLYELRPPAP
ncbi:MAG: glycosyltransferase family 39 protein [Elusimicrobia bacterium]|nr:glycosyltransferase family 39 protein [Elusimicrobiota bacterium]